MGMVDYELERGDVKPINTFAQNMYNKQLKSITNIAHTDGYKEIKRYWTSIKESAETDLKTVTAENLPTIQMKCNIADQFIHFLDNLESAVEISQKSK